jgi:hypothetical protein
MSVFHRFCISIGTISSRQLATKYLMSNTDDHYESPESGLRRSMQEPYKHVPVDSSWSRMPLGLAVAYSCYS